MTVYGLRYSPFCFVYGRLRAGALYTCVVFLPLRLNKHGSRAKGPNKRKMHDHEHIPLIVYLMKMSRFRKRVNIRKLEKTKQFHQRYIAKTSHLRTRIKQIAYIIQQVSTILSQLSNGETPVKTVAVGKSTVSHRFNPFSSSDLLLQR